MYGCADMAELADALDLGSNASGMQVRPLLSAPQRFETVMQAVSNLLFVLTIIYLGKNVWMIFSAINSS